MGTPVRQLQKRFSLFPALSFSISIRLYLSIFLSRSLLRHRNKHCSSCSSHFTSSANSSSTWRLIKSASALAHLTRHLSEPTADCQVSWHTVHKIHKLLDMLSISINALWRFVDDVPLGQVDEDHQHDAPSQTQSARSDSSESNVLHFPELLSMSKFGMLNLVLLWICWTLSSSDVFISTPTTFSHTVSVMIARWKRKAHLGPLSSCMQLALLCFSRLFCLIERYSALGSVTRNENKSASVQTSRIDISGVKVRVCRAWHQVHPAAPKAPAFNNLQGESTARGRQIFHDLPFQILSL